MTDAGSTSPVFDLTTLTEPIVQAPLAGGPSTPELTIAVCEAGGLGFIASGYKRADAVREEIAAVRAATERPFGVNIFVPTREPADPGRLLDYLRELAPEAARQGVDLGEPRHEDDEWEGKLELVCAEHVPVVSFTFGCPDAAVVERLHRAEIAVWVTVTRPAEALEAQSAGADALIVQGAEAGGHRGGFSDGDEAGELGLLPLLRLVTRTVPLPLIAAGGIADGAAVAAVLCAGARAAALGTALMLCPEAGTSDAQRTLLSEPGATRLTRAFTGRLARGIVNRFMLEHSASAPVAYPEIHHVTSLLRAAARKRGDADAFNLWAGQAHELALARPAGELVRDIGADARRALREAGERLSHAG
ncbi:MAG: nitronate monooxygenase [Solirubrobacterales bacterium]|nr:nitronate monooxygenase [Solirubrobacterales bacterium]